MRLSFPNRQSSLAPHQVLEPVETSSTETTTKPSGMGFPFGSIIIWLIFILLTGGILWYFLWGSVPLNYGGDIAEYHGITESIIKSGTLWLTPIAANNIATYLQPAYLHNPEYYIYGLGGHRWPVHFIFYSLVAVLIRLVLHLFSLNELNTLRVTNLVIIALTTWYI